MKKILLRICLIGFFLGQAYTSFASLSPTIHSTSAGGLWSDTSTWQEGRIPTEIDVVEVSGPVEIFQSTTIHGLQVDSNGQLQPRENTVNTWDTMRTLAVTGDVENGGIIKKEKLLRDPNAGPDPSAPSNPQLSLSVGGSVNNNGQILPKVSLYGEGTKQIDGINPVDIILSTDIHLGGSVYIGNLQLENHTLTIDTTNTILVSSITSGGTITDISGTSDGKIYIGSIYYIMFPLVVDVPVVEMNGTFDTYDTRVYFKKLLLVGGGSINGPLYANSVDIYGSYENKDIGGDHTIFADTTLKTTGKLALRYSYITSDFITKKLFTIDGVFINEGTVESIYDPMLTPIPPALNIGVTKGIKNTGTITGKVGAVWAPVNGATNYTLILSGYQPMTVSGLYYNLSSFVSNSLLTWTVQADDGSSPTTPAPTPTNLGQWIEMPDPDNHSHLPREEIGLGKELGYKIGHFQSGSGIILSAYVDNQTGKEIQLQFTLTNGSGQILPPYMSTGFTTGTGEVTIPDLSAGDYTWQVKTVGTGLTDSAQVSHSLDTSNPDFAIFYGFEPYPYGYKFHNHSLTGSILTGGIDTWTYIFPFYNPTKIDGNKWDIFDTAFDTTGLIKYNSDGTVDSDKKYLDAFASLGLNEDNPQAFGGQCYGLSVSALMTKYHPDFLNSLSVSQQVGTGTLWWKVKPLHTENDDPENPWDNNGSTNLDPILKNILTLQLSQANTVNQDAEGFSKKKEPIEILQELKDYPDKNYVLGFWGKKESELGKPVFAKHYVVPYKVEGNKIYYWDNNIQAPFRDSELFPRQNSYRQYIEILQNSRFKMKFYESYQSRTSLDDLVIVDIDTLYHQNSKSTVIGFNDTDTAYSFLGAGDFYVRDTLGRISGFFGGNILEQIPGLNVVTNGSDLLYTTPDNTFKQLYLPQKMDGLTLHIDGTTDEKYTLMIAGGDYYQKLEGVTTSSGQTDTFTTTGTGLTINFDDTKTGTYSLLMDNFHDYGTTNTGTVYIDSANVIPQSQQYSIDWNKVLQNTNDATQHTVDINNDGVIGDSGDTTTNLPPVFQDITPPTTTATLTGTLTPNSTGSYYDTATINLNATDNTNGSGVEKTYYSINTGSILTYTGGITLTNTGTTTNNYILNYYSVDKFNNTELTQTISFSITKTPTITKGGIQGVIYEDKNLNGKRDTKETGLKDWKVYALKVDTKRTKENEEESKDREKGNNKKQESLEKILKRFQRDTKEQTKVLQSKLKTTTDVNGNYNFTNVEDGVYIVLEGVEKWWLPVNPILGIQIVEIQNGQQVTNKNFGNKNTKKR